MRYFCDNMRHLVCVPYTEENLHAMAEDLDIHRCWFDGDHYDIPKRRVDEIQGQAEVVSPKEIVQLLKSNDVR